MVPTPEWMHARWEPRDRRTVGDADADAGEQNSRWVMQMQMEWEQSKGCRCTCRDDTREDTVNDTCYTATPRLFQPPGPRQA